MMFKITFKTLFKQEKIQRYNVKNIMKIILCRCINHHDCIFELYIFLEFGKQKQANYNIIFEYLNRVMLQKGKYWNPNMLKNKLNLQSNRPSFLQDQNWQTSSKITKQYKGNDKQRPSIKKQKLFDIQKMKQQLGMIELRNNMSEQFQPMSRISKKDSTQQLPSFKKQKSEQYVIPAKQAKLISTLKQNSPVMASATVTCQNSGFTDRISQLVKMRQQHEKIINSLVNNKKPVSTYNDSESSVFSRNKNKEPQNKYTRVVEQYRLYKSQKQININARPQNQKSQVNVKIKIGRVQSIGKQRKQGQQKLFQIRSNSSQNLYIKNSQNMLKSQKFSKREQVKIGSDIKKLVIDKAKQSQGNRSSQYPQSRISSIRNESFTESLPNEQLDQSTFEVQQHVNLLASLSQFDNKAEYLLTQRSNVPLQQQLHFSIQQLLKNKFNQGHRNKFNQGYRIQIIYAGINANYSDYQQLPNAIKRVNSVNRDFTQVVEFITQNQFWQGLFSNVEMEYFSRKNQQEILEVNQYFGLCFDTGNYVQKNISYFPLRECQKKLLLIKKSDVKQLIIVDITFILLSRIIDITANPSFPSMLNKLFGYQSKTFNIQKLDNFIEFLQFTDRLREIHQKQLRNQGGFNVEDKLDQSLRDKYSVRDIEESDQENDQVEVIQDTLKHCDFQIYGYNKIILSFQTIKYSFFSQKHNTQTRIPLYEFRSLMKSQRYMRKVAQKYSKLSIINKKQLPVKTFNLKHFQNHFVVVSINVVEQGLHFISVGNKCSKQNEQTKNTRYRLCLISTLSKTILQCLILQNNQSFPLYLPVQQFQVYISAYNPTCLQRDQEQVIQNKSYEKDHEIVYFTFYVQSQHVIAKLDSTDLQKVERKQLQFHLRLKQQYKKYTSTIIQQFIQFSLLQKEIFDFFSQLHIQTHQSPTLLQHLIGNNPVHQSNLSVLTPLKFQQYQGKLQQAFYNQCNLQKQQKINKKQQKQVRKIVDEVLQFSTFEQTATQPQALVINILRVHLKSLDLFIDCIDTQIMTQFNQYGNQQQPEITVRYGLPRVLCDINHQKNTIILRPGTINLIYLTKNAPIRQIINERLSQSRIKNKIENEDKKIKYNLFTRQW